MATKTSAKNKKVSGRAYPKPVTRGKHVSFLREIERLAPWETWAQKLVDRKKPVSLRKLLPASAKTPLAWTLSRDMPEDSVELIVELDMLRKRRHADEPADWARVVGDWLDRTQADGTHSVHFGVECVAWAHGLSKLAPRLNAETWWDLFTFLMQTCTDALAAFTLDTKFSDPDHTTIGQLITAELPMTMAYWFPKIDACRDLLDPARSSMGESLVELLDGEGMMNARFCPRLRSILSIWTRCCFLDRQFSQGRISQDARLQFEWFVRQCLRLRNVDGSFALEPNSLSRELQNGLMVSALEIAGDKTDLELYACQRRKLSDLSASHLPSPAEHSEWAELAVLKSDWSKKSITYVFGYPEHQLRTELTVGESLILKGQDNPELKVDGKSVAMKSPWEEVCWETDDDMDYVEVESTFENGFRIQRQVLLAREDRFLFTADAVIGHGNSKLTYRRKLPIATGIQTKSKPDTREESIHAKNPLGTIIPVSLPEWRDDSHTGDYHDGEITHIKNGKNLYSALFIDLAPNRNRKALTFRQLTVAEKLQIQSNDVAVAYRVQIGDEHWVIYRSLETPENRTFLGQNITSEFLLARFAEGELDNLIEISS